ncbi:MAG: response regulator [Lachnospiraceae bacterium]|nr:response regulator [Lachnospiraceae bacterium]
MRVLIVDDEPMMPEKMKSIVEEVRPEAEITCADNYIGALKAAEHTVYEVAFLDIEMPGMNGLELARRLKEIYPDINIIFATSHSEYAVEAFAMCASGYLLKPIQKKNVEEAFNNLRKPVRYEDEKLKVQCFGNFEVFYRGKPVRFGRSLAKELFACLIDLKGASANTAQLCAILWEDSAEVEKNRHYFRNLVSELRKVLRECHAERAFICQRNSFAVDVKQVECDYYKFLEHDAEAVSSYNGEYMKQYSWAEITAGELKMKEKSL